MLEHKIKNEHLVLTTPVFTVVDLDIEHGATGKDKVFTTMLIEDWVNIVAEDANGNIVLIKQWRAGINALTSEIPGGKIDKNETALEAGLRELKEETGYIPSKESKTIDLGWVYANPAIQNNKMHFYYINNIVKEEDLSLDEFEMVYTSIVNKYKIMEMIEGKQITHAYSVLGLYKALK